MSLAIVIKVKIFLLKNNDSQHVILTASSGDTTFLMRLKLPLIGRVGLPAKPLPMLMINRTLFSCSVRLFYTVVAGKHFEYIFQLGIHKMRLF